MTYMGWSELPTSNVSVANPLPLSGNHPYRPREWRAWGIFADILFCNPVNQSMGVWDFSQHQGGCKSCCFENLKGAFMWVWSCAAEGFKTSLLSRHDPETTVLNTPMFGPASHLPILATPTPPPYSGNGER